MTTTCSNCRYAEDAGTTEHAPDLVCMYADVRCDVYVKPTNTCPQWAAEYSGERDRRAGDGMTGSNCHIRGPMNRWLSPVDWFLVVLSALNRRAMFYHSLLPSRTGDSIMIKVGVFYPNSENCKFDIDYYCKSHMPMVRDRLGITCQGIAVDKGLTGGAPGSRPAYAAIGHLYFETAAAFQAAFGPHAKEIMADLPNFTNIEPSIQISSVAINATRDKLGELHMHFS
jgi:uncharacterized protein (TIGR02118 family)